MTDQISTLRTFIRVARTGSFSRVAQELNLSQPTVSRTIAELERTLGTVLFSRTTRAVTLTEAGADYLIKVQSVLDTLDEANHAVRGDETLRGVLRVGASSIFASRVLVHRLGGFMAAHPALRVELLIDDKRQDLIADGIDVALRFGRMADSSAVARKIGQWPLMIAASPAYLAQHGTPRTPAELTDHVAIIAGPVAGKGWTFEGPDGAEATVKMDGSLLVTAGEVGIAAGLASLGVVAASYTSIKQELAAGTLVQLLPDWSMGMLDCFAVFPGGQAAKPSAKAFADFLQRDLRDFQSAPATARSLVERDPEHLHLDVQQAGLHRGVVGRDLRCVRQIIGLEEPQAPVRKDAVKAAGL
ncbi:MAG: LysR substrate-binding domain-containing protein, partial [Phenylobacterium sp.]